MVIVLAIVRKVRGFKSVRVQWNLTAIKFRSTTYLREGEGVEPSAPCRKISRYAKDHLRYDGDTEKQNSATIYLRVSSHFATRCLLQPEQRTVLDKSGMVSTQMGSTLYQKMVAIVRDALYEPPRNNNRY
jgi:hypothetical protein